MNISRSALGAATAFFIILCLIVGKPLQHTKRKNVHVLHKVLNNITPSSVSEESGSLPEPYSRLSEFDNYVRTYCENTKTKHNIIPQKSYGTLPKGPARLEYHKKGCGGYFSAKMIESRAISSCPQSNYQRSMSFSNSSGGLPLVAVMAASTTRTLTSPDTKTLALFTMCFPSLTRALDCGFRYVFVLGFDKGDPFFDSKKGLEILTTWFEANVASVLRARGIMIELLPLAVSNDMKKPGPVFNEMARAAYDRGADFFYRINDDIEFRDNFAEKYTKTLTGLSLPYGVVGPTSVGKEYFILTVDFVHRTHMEIFDGNYYPPALYDWWMDNWISHVYGYRRSFKSKDIKVFHHTEAHGQRYTVRDRNKGNTLLLEEVKKGGAKIEAWMRKQNLPPSDVQVFVEDSGQIALPKGVKALKDIPF